MTDSEVQEEQLQDRKPKPKSVRQLFDSLSSFEQLTKQFIFYTPVTYYLIADQRRTEFSTDLISNLLGSVIQEHPLVITELPRPIFQPAETLLLNEGQRAFMRTLYAVPIEAWLNVKKQLETLNIIDQTTRRFCILRPHTETIPCPFGKFEHYPLPVEYFNCYGNKETYFFHQPEKILLHGLEDSDSTPQTPTLHYTSPIREIVDFGSRFFETIEASKPVAVFSEQYKTGGNPLDAYMETQQTREERLAAIQKKNKLHETLAAKPLSESQVSAATRAECYELIRRYREIYGTANE